MIPSTCVLVEVLEMFEYLRCIEGGNLQVVPTWEIGLQWLNLDL